MAVLFKTGSSLTKQFYTTQISNLKTQKLESFEGNRTLKENFCFLVFFFFISQSCCSALLNFTYFWSRFRLHIFEELRMKLKMIFAVFVFCWQLLFSELRYTHAPCRSFLRALPKEAFFRRAACSFNTSAFQCHEHRKKQLKKKNLLFQRAINIRELLYLLLVSSLS